MSSGATAEQAAQIEQNKQDIADINDILNELMYEEISIATFSNDVNTVEIGSIINNVTLTWSINKTPTVLALDDVSIDSSTTSKALISLGLTTDKTWTLKAIDEKDITSQKTTSVKFYNGVYYGVSSNTTYDNAFILSFTKTLANSKAKTFTVIANEGEYIYYCLPSRFGDCSFNVSGFDGGFTKVNTINFTNSSGYTETYDIYKSDNANLGSTTVKVS